MQVHVHLGPEVHTRGFPPLSIFFLIGGVSPKMEFSHSAEYIYIARKREYVWRNPNKDFDYMCNIYQNRPHCDPQQILERVLKDYSYIKYVFFKKKKK